MTRHQKGYGCALALIWIGVFLLSIAFACAWRGLYKCVIKTEIPSTIRLGPGDAGTCYVSHEKGDRWPIPCKIRVTCLRADTTAPVDVRDEYSTELCSFFVQRNAEYKVEFFPSGRESSNAALAKLTWAPVGVYEWRSFVLGAIMAATGLVAGLVTFAKSRITNSRHVKAEKTKRAAGSDYRPVPKPPGLRLRIRRFRRPTVSPGPERPPPILAAPSPNAAVPASCARSSGAGPGLA
jgi:hypothetical protein